MVEVIANCLKGDNRTLEYKVWSKVADQTAKLITRYLEQVSTPEQPDDPFAYNETASVSVLSAAAAMAGYVGLAEFATTKAALGNVNRGQSLGRSDFWMSAEKRSWAFEFKQWCPVSAPSKRLRSYMKKAEECAGQILENDADVSVAGLIIPFFYLDKKKTGSREQARKNIEDFLSECDFAWEFNDKSRSIETYLMLNIVRRF